MYSYCGIISKSIVAELSSQINPHHSTHEFIRKMKMIHQNICQQIERFHEIAKSALQSEYKNIRKKAASIISIESVEEPAPNPQDSRPPNARKKRRRNHRAGTGLASKRFKVHQPDDHSSVNLCSGIYCDIAAASGMSRNPSASSDNHCDKCLKLQWVDISVREIFKQCCTNNTLCYQIQEQVRPDGFLTTHLKFIFPNITRRFI